MVAGLTGMWLLWRGPYSGSMSAPSLSPIAHDAGFDCSSGSKTLREPGRTPDEPQNRSDTRSLRVGRPSGRRLRSAVFIDLT